MLEKFCTEIRTRLSNWSPTVWIFSPTYAPTIMQAIPGIYKIPTFGLVRSLLARGAVDSVDAAYAAINSTNSNLDADLARLRTYWAVAKDDVPSDWTLAELDSIMSTVLLQAL